MRSPSLLNDFDKSSTAFNLDFSLVWGIVPFVIFLSWVGMSTSGHTKRITVNAIVLIAYAVGNAVGPFMWQAKYKPRNKVPFAIISACSVASAFTLFITRQYLSYQNKKREEEAAAGTGKEDKYDQVYITVMEGGQSVEKKVDRVCFILRIHSSTSHTRVTFFSPFLLRLSKISQTFKTESGVTPFRMLGFCSFTPEPCLLLRLLRSLYANEMHA